jgi:hypothetical protein
MGGGGGVIKKNSFILYNKKLKNNFRDSCHGVQAGQIYDWKQIHKKRDR